MKRTIFYLESLYSSHVIALVISPLSFTSRWSTISMLNHFISETENEDLEKLLNQKFSLPVLSMRSGDYATKLAQICLEHFSQ